MEKEEEEKQDERSVCIQNPHLDLCGDDYLYHFNLGTQTHNLPEMFGDVKYVFVGGSSTRMRIFIEYIAVELHMESYNGDYPNICVETDRYVMYKVGPVLAVSHGMGIPSMAIMMHELIKLLFYAQCKDVICIRIGTSGGLGFPPGSVIVTKRPVDATFEPKFEQLILGEVVSRSTELDSELAEELLACGKEIPQFKTIFGDTMCTLDFYEGQARLDGAFCFYNEEEKMSYLQRAKDAGVCNIEMETTVFAAMCHMSGLRGGVVCVTLLDRLKNDQISDCHEVLLEYQDRPQILVCHLIKKRLQAKKLQSVKSMKNKK